MNNKERKRVRAPPNVLATWRRIAIKQHLKSTRNNNDTAVKTAAVVTEANAAATAANLQPPLNINLNFTIDIHTHQI